MVVTYTIIQHSVPFAVLGTMGFKRSQLFPCSHPILLPTDFLPKSNESCRLLMMLCGPSTVTLSH